MTDGHSVNHISHMRFIKPGNKLSHEVIPTTAIMNLTQHFPLFRYVLFSSLFLKLYNLEPFSHYLENKNDSTSQ